ncbi:cytochrome c oxidase subunit II [Nocardioides panacisoli]|uniref:aa3-type cytochrome oxidase subunit II n=1 Tax=Nocardioides panacisoli TaxID=627624 RepID=UPI001C62876C|nr:cytochrome c oxidase subunit II [Nocardioides panacisoli]QYJ04696.1 cytochrome c oxidase subunit II [Nocardioides panacisoli]
MPEIVTEQGQSILGLWQGAWIAAIAVGIVTWALILWSVFWFRRRSDDEVPVQTRYNLPIEIFYTVFPIVMVVVFFSKTVEVQNIALEHVEDPDVNVTVVGQKWSWTFNYPETGPEGENLFVSGFQPSEQDDQLSDTDLPTLVIPVDQTTEFDLYSPDVIHSFGIPAFAMKMDVVPGNDNSFQVTPTETGRYEGKCYELCGAYHSRMLFHVEVVSEQEYEAHLAELAANPDNVSEEPVTGGRYADEAYLDGQNETEGEQE